MSLSVSRARALAALTQSALSERFLAISDIDADNSVVAAAALSMLLDELLDVSAACSACVTLSLDFTRSLSAVELIC